MATTSLRQHLLNGGKSYGPLVLSDSPVVAEILGLMGYGHIIVDHEHGPTNVRSGQALLQAIDAAQFISKKRTETIVRLPGPNDPVYMKKVLDSLRLPGGVLVPMVDDARTAEAVVRATRYPQQLEGNTGIRGCAAPFVRGNSWGLVSDMDEYLRQCEEDLFVMVQVETMAGVRAIPEIASVPGVDAIFIGPFDLSASAGKMGQMKDTEVKRIIADAEESVRRCEDCLLAGFRSPDRNLKTMFDEDGYSLVCGSVDIGLLREAALLDVQAGNDAINGL